MNREFIGSVWVLTRLFLREILYHGPLRHQDEERRSLTGVLALFITLGGLLTLWLNFEFLAFSPQLLPPMTIWHNLERVFSYLFMMILALSLYLWPSMGMSGVARRILSPVIPAKTPLIISKVLAHVMVVLFLGLAFLLPADLTLTVLILPRLALPILPFAGLFLVYGLMMVWLGYFLVVALQGLLAVLPGSLGRGLALIFRSGLLLLMIFYLLMPERYLSEWLGNCEGASSLSFLWPVLWLLAVMMNHFISVSPALLKFIPWTLWACLLLPVIFLLCQWLSLRFDLGHSSGGTSRASSGCLQRFGVIWGQNTLSQFFFRVLLCRYLLRRLLISLAIPAGMILMAVVYELQVNPERPFLWPSAFSSFALSAWLLWLVPMSAWLTTQSVAAEGAWVFRQLPQGDMFKLVRRSYFRVVAVILTVFSLPLMALVCWSHPWPLAVRTICLLMAAAYFMLSCLCGRLNYLPFIAQLLPDSWLIGRLWLLYGMGYLLGISLLAGLAHWGGGLEWLEWAMVVLGLMALIVFLWLRFGHRDDRDLVYEQEAMPVIMSISDHMG